MLPDGKAYFPITVGQTMIYQVDSINYFSNGALLDSTRSYVREEITELLTDTNGEERYKLERSVRRDSTQEWQIADVWVVSRDDAGVYRTEENLRFIKLVFPLTENRIWRHNAFIDENISVVVKSGEVMQPYINWRSSVSSLTDTVNLSNAAYTDVAVVIQADEDNLIQRRYVEENYAKDVGLIYREILILDSQNTTSTAAWEEKAEKGFIVRQELISR
ncbi:MAG: hypothetical protein AAGK47_05405 [Bacteroidota bacterium]